MIETLLKIKDAFHHYLNFAQLLDHISLLIKRITNSYFIEIFKLYLLNYFLNIVSLLPFFFFFCVF
jgi:hypothetical protein